MELWIKSQDGRKLVKTNIIGYGDYIDAVSKKQVFYVYADNMCRLGEYQNEETCIHTIELIEGLLRYREPKNGIVVYEMPEND